MNKIIVPKHVEAWMFDMWVDIWPIRVKMWQLFIIAIWFAIFFGIVNGLKKWWLWTVPAVLIWSPVMIITLFIAFFKKSELQIIPFAAKLIRTYIINSPKSFQRNIIKPSDREIKISYSKLNYWEDKKVEQKELKKDEMENNLNVLEKW